MTQRQLDLLRYLRAYMVAHDGVAPSFEEMRTALSLASRSGVHRLLQELEDQGFIRRVRAKARRIDLIDKEPPSAITAVRRTPFALGDVRDCDLLTECARRGLLRAAA